MLVHTLAVIPPGCIRSGNLAGLFTAEDFDVFFHNYERLLRLLLVLEFYHLVFWAYADAY